MARSDYVALVIEPAAEYFATTELRRFGLTSAMSGQTDADTIQPHLTSGPNT